ncbi:LysR family transcriptional regulator [Herbaspirillum robiniae]|uniref:LysR family transcriptional regulator n=1 Tax=Herbaspirillum robiniae TaxID=2014887 RepID=A0A246WPF2_9BURK|nr:LysR family transcriptional regulator [Herbaspirillum robiniae]OWY28226.1 LysR family transcriptional regulator [Herbaspirillum robiniae]
MDRLNAMEIFVCVADAKSFAKAAAILDISPASVTKAVQSLEDHLGLRLLQRTTRRLSLTPEGEAICEDCRRIISDVADLAAGDGSRVLRGRLRVDMPASLAKTVIIPVVSGFIASHPDMELVLGVGDKSVDLVEDGVDCAIRVGLNSDSSLVAQTIGAMQRVSCAAPTYIARRGKPESVEDLAGHSVIRYFPKGGWRDVSEEFIIEGKSIEVKMRSAIAVNDVDTYLACGLQGLGIIRIGRYLAQEHLDSGALVEIVPQWTTPPTPISAIYPARRHLSPKVRAFISWAGEVFAAHPSLHPVR